MSGAAEQSEILFGYLSAKYETSFGSGSEERLRRGKTLLQHAADARDMQHPVVFYCKGFFCPAGREGSQQLLPLKLTS